MSPGDRILLLLSDRVARSQQTIATLVGLPPNHVGEVVHRLRFVGLIERNEGLLRILPAGMERVFDVMARKEAR